MGPDFHMLPAFKRGPLFVLHTSKNLGNKKALAPRRNCLLRRRCGHLLGNRACNFERIKATEDRPLESAKKVGNVSDEWGATRDTRGTLGAMYK